LASSTKEEEGQRREWREKLSSPMTVNLSRLVEQLRRREKIRKDQRARQRVHTNRKQARHTLCNDDDDF
jgi:hypothetical protein